MFSGKKARKNAPKRECSVQSKMSFLVYVRVCLCVFVEIASGFMIYVVYIGLCNPMENQFH